MHKNQTTLNGHRAISQTEYKKQEKQFVNSILYALRAPHIFHNDWGASFPKKTLDRSVTYRLAELPKLMEKQMCTDYEVALYLSSVSMSFPLDHEWSNIYFNVFAKYFDIKLVLGDEPLVKLYDNEIQELNGLKRQIFKSQMERIKELDRH